MQNFFYITGIVTWSIIGLAVTIFIGFCLVALVNNYIYPTLDNLFFAIFGGARLRRKGIVGDELINLFQNKQKSKRIRRHQHSWKYLRRLAYIRLLNEYRKAIYSKIDNK